MKFLSEYFSKIFPNINVSLNSDPNKDTLREYQYTFLIIYHSALRSMRNVSDKHCVENLIYFFYFNSLFFSKILSFVRLVGSVLEPDKPQMKIMRMRIAYWIPNATNTHSQYVIIIAFPL